MKDGRRAGGARQHSNRSELLRKPVKSYLVANPKGGIGASLAVLLECDHVVVHQQSRVAHTERFGCFICTKQEAEATALREAEERKKAHPPPAVSAALQLLAEEMGKSGMTAAQLIEALKQVGR